MNTLQSKSLEQPVGTAQAGGIVRRRLILASLGKGAVVAASVAVPMRSLANVSTLVVTANGRLCTISGVQSGVHSGQTNPPVCSGYSPGYYKKLEHWPNYSASNPLADNAINGGSGSFNSNTPFKDLFGRGSSESLLNCLQDTPTLQVEFHWVAALLNGTPGSPAINYPYTAQKVIELYKAGDGTVNDSAWKFFSGYMETHTS